MKQERIDELKELLQSFKKYGNELLRRDISADYGPTLASYCYILARRGYLVKQMSNESGGIKFLCTPQFETYVNQLTPTIKKEKRLKIREPKVPS